MNFSDSHRITEIQELLKKRFYSDGIDRSLNGYTNSRGSVAAEVYSAPFKVYSAKKFPGMTGTKRAT